MSAADALIKKNKAIQSVKPYVELSPILRKDYAPFAVLYAA